MITLTGVEHKESGIWRCAQFNSEFELFNLTNMKNAVKGYDIFSFTPVIM